VLHCSALLCFAVVLTTRQAKQFATAVSWLFAACWAVHIAAAMGGRARTAPDVSGAEGGSRADAGLDPTTAAVSTNRVPTPSHARRSA